MKTAVGCLRNPPPVIPKAMAYLIYVVISSTYFFNTCFIHILIKACGKENLDD
jgi:hypothetical protein